MAWMFSTAAFKSRGELMEAEEDEEEDSVCDGGSGGGGEVTGSDATTASSEDWGAVEVLASNANVSRRGGEPEMFISNWSDKASIANQLTVRTYTD